MAAKISAARKGKRSEFLMMAELLEEGFTVYQPLVDEGIDCIVEGKGNKFYPIQIKSRAEFTEGDIVNIHSSTLYKEMFIMLYDVKTRHYWIIPANEYREHLSHPYPAKSRETQHRLTMTKRIVPNWINMKEKKG